MSEKILIVDDEPEIADLVALYLKNENFTVYVFYTAREALELSLIHIFPEGAGRFPHSIRRNRNTHSHHPSSSGTLPRQNIGKEDQWLSHFR